MLLLSDFSVIEPDGFVFVVLGVLILLLSIVLYTFYLLIKALRKYLNEK